MPALRASAQTFALRSPFDRQGMIFAKEHVGMPPSRFQTSPNNPQFEPLVGPICEQFACHGPFADFRARPQPVQGVAALGKVNRPAIVGIDEVEIP